MIYLGIDVAKNSHVASAMTSEGEVLLKPFSFTNSCSGFSALSDKLFIVGLYEFRKSVDNYIIFYNTVRPQSMLAYKAPERFEQEYYKKKNSM